MGTRTCPGVYAEDVVRTSREQPRSSVDRSHPGGKGSRVEVAYLSWDRGLGRGGREYGEKL